MDRLGVNKSSEWNFIKMILTKNQERGERNKEWIGIRKSRCVESDGTYYYTVKFNMALSLCRVLGVALYFSEGFSEVAVGGLAVAEVLWPLEVAMVCFLEQESNLWSSVPQ